MTISYHFLDKEMKKATGGLNLEYWTYGKVSDIGVNYENISQGKQESNES